MATADVVKTLLEMWKHSFVELKGNSEGILKAKLQNVIYLVYSRHLYYNAVVRFDGISSQMVLLLKYLCILKLIIQ